MSFNFKYSKPLVLVFVLIGVLLVSGCVNQSAASSGSPSGLVIKNVYTDPQQDLIEAGDELKIYYDIQNTGGTIARNVQTTIYGFTWISEEDRLNNKELFKIIDALYPPDPITKSAGETDNVAFDIKVPEGEKLLSRGLRKTFPLKIRASYDYETSATTSILGYSRTRYIRDLQTGSQTPIISETQLPVQTTISGTPLAISVSGPDKLIIHDVKSGQPSQQFRYTYHITLTNIGQGYPITYGGQNNAANQEGLVKLDMRIEGAAVKFYDCLENKNVDKIEDSLIKLRSGSTTFSCTISIQNEALPSGQYEALGRDSWGNREFDTINLYFHATYRYFLEKDFSVTITGPTR